MSGAPLTERDLQNIVAARVHVRADLAIVPNCGALGHESDLLRLTGTRQAWEYEIKVSRSDFRADLKKSRHRKLTWAKDVGLAPRDAAARYPQRFYYAVLEGVATVDDVPAYAGLLIVRQVGTRWTVDTVKQAPRLHQERASDQVQRYLARGMTIRYWQEREGVNPKRAERDRIRDAMREQRERERQRAADMKAYIAQREGRAA